MQSPLSDSTCFSWHDTFQKRTISKKHEQAWLAWKGRRKPPLSKLNYNLGLPLSEQMSFVCIRPKKRFDQNVQHQNQHKVYQHKCLILSSTVVDSFVYSHRSWAPCIH
ncbi:hypothetical protein CHARACLAT_031376 [Characodon lateralis]|uniref:Uncharacterized protein n=1 Tax=Characodon lateralis TaxID=208331 RepID=A0ABU7DVT2_9TELE|nr:hypothetical protein [Characodon lateralis]